MNQDTPATKLVPMISASSEAPRKNHGTVPEGVCLCWFSQRPQWVYRALMTTARGNVSKIFQKENPENSSHSFWAQLHSKSANLIHLCQLESSFPVSRITLSQVAKQRLEPSHSPSLGNSKDSESHMFFTVGRGYPTRSAPGAIFFQNGAKDVNPCRWPENKEGETLGL